MSEIECWKQMAEQVYASARAADVPLMSPPRLPEAGQSMSAEILRLRSQLAGAVAKLEALEGALRGFLAEEIVRAALTQPKET